MLTRKGGNLLPETKCIVEDIGYDGYRRIGISFKLMPLHVDVGPEERVQVRPLEFHFHSYDIFFSPRELRYQLLCHMR